MPSANGSDSRYAGIDSSTATSSSPSVCRRYCLNTSDDAYCICSRGAANTTPWPPRIQFPQRTQTRPVKMQRQSLNAPYSRSQGR